MPKKRYDLKNPKNSKAIQAILREGMSTPFWDIILQACDDSIEHLLREQDSNDMSDLSPEAYKVEAEIMKSKRNNILKLKKMPESIIVFLEEPDQSEPDFDPYATAKDFRESNTD